MCKLHVDKNWIWFVICKICGTIEWKNEHVYYFPLKVFKILLRQSTMFFFFFIKKFFAL